MARHADFRFDVGCPAAYRAWTQLPQRVAATGARIVPVAFLRGGVFQATGNRSPVQVPARRRCLVEDLQRLARRCGMPLRHNPRFPVNTLVPMRIATGLAMRGPARLAPCVDVLFRAAPAQGRKLDDAATLAAVLQEAGFDAPALRALTAEPEVKERLEAVAQAAVARGVSGAPAFPVGEAMSRGQDRLDFVKEALQ